MSMAELSPGLRELLSRGQRDKWWKSRKLQPILWPVSDFGIDCVARSITCGDEMWNGAESNHCDAEMREKDEVGGDEIPFPGQRNKAGSVQNVKTEDNQKIRSSRAAKLVFLGRLN